MAEFPALMLWTDAYLADTTHLTTIEHGAYLLLLMAMWRTKTTSLPDDPKKLCRYVKMTPAQWARTWPSLKGFFRSQDGELTQGRLSDEAEAVRQHSKQQSDRAKRRWLKEKDTTDATASIRHSHGNAPTTTSIKKERVAKATPKKAAFGSLSLTPEMTTYALEKGCSNVPELFAAFRDYHVARDNRFSDWVAAWQTWVRNDRKFAPQNSLGVNGQRSGPAGTPSLARAAMAVIAANSELELRPNGVHSHENLNGNGAGRSAGGGSGIDSAGRTGRGDDRDSPLPVIDQEPVQR